MTENTLKIVRAPDERLARVCEPVAFEEDMVWLATGMLEAMQRERGIGLAAPQVGEDCRLIIGGHPSVGWGFAIVNPEIVKQSSQTYTSVEGCLSFPGKLARVKRHKIVTVTGYDLEWRPVKVKARGLLAACLQHEIDHLDGRTIL